MSFWAITRAETPWADWGPIAVHGDGAYVDGVLHIVRTGPTCPPVFLPANATNAIVITAKAKKRLEDHALTGFVALPAVVDRVTHVRWDEWNRAFGAAPPVRGGPEALLRGKHDASDAAVIGKVWELVGEMQQFQDIAAGLDFVRIQHRQGPLLVSDAAREVLTELAGEWLSFSPKAVQRIG